MMMTDFITKLCFVITSEGKTQEKESKGKTKENKMQISTTFFFFSSLPSIFPKRTNEINIFLKKKKTSYFSFPIKKINNNNKKRSKPATICVHHKMHYMQKKKTNENSLQPNKQKMKQKKKQIQKYL